MHSLFIRYIGLHVIEQLSMLGRLREEVYRMEQTIKRLKMKVFIRSFAYSTEIHKRIRRDYEASLCRNTKASARRGPSSHST